MRSDIIADRWRDVALEARALVYHGSPDQPALVPLSDVHSASYIAELTIAPAGSDLALLHLDEPIDAERELLALLVEAPADIKALLAEVGQLEAHLMVDNGLIDRACAVIIEMLDTPTGSAYDRARMLLRDIKAWRTGRLSDDRA